MGPILPDMQTPELEQLRKNPLWRTTLRVYWEHQTALRQSSPEFDGWVPRLGTIAEVEPSQLSGIHGRLIAFGFLKFDLSNRDVGMRYQLTPMAKQAIGAEPTSETTEPSELAESA